MFGGIVETTGVVEDLDIINNLYRFAVTPHLTFSDVSVGDSIAVNGVCVTVTHLLSRAFLFEAVPETLRVTNFKELKKGSHVNLERSLFANSRIGGHFVQGHVDCVGEILEIKEEDKAWLVKISLPITHARYLINKGYITIDGMSITVINATQDWFTVTLIPHTQNVTIAKSYRVGDLVNLETDMMGKYIEKFMQVTTC